ncbi:MAG: SpoVT / AbrB like domain protein [Candidatus Methanolliviera sp. GoM_oil]|nr:MAG: SpoVT / AbrB like domain protein [Candidatus Methanolliviera sp. GoM_oil]
MASVTRKYQITIPKRVREDLGIKAGNDVVFLKTEDGYKIIRTDEIIEEGVRIFRDITETVKEIKAGLGKGLIE